MSDTTSIEWTDASWPVVTGCTHISPGCDRCYSARLTSTRLRHLPEYAGLASNGRFNGTVRCLPDRLDWPLKWRKPKRIFVSDMADLFHDQVPDEYLVRVFDVMLNARRHTFQVLTKRHARMRSFVTRYLSGEFAAEPLDRAPLAATVDRPPANVWLGVSAEDQKWADIRIPALLDTPAAIRFVSAEPLLGPIDLSSWIGADHGASPGDLPAPGGRGKAGGDRGGLRSGVPDDLSDSTRRSSISWLIAGGESGSGARPCELSWLRSLHDQCASAGVPYFLKQLGSVAGREWDAGPKGGDWDKWPEDLRVREFPPARHAVTA